MADAGASAPTPAIAAAALPSAMATGIAGRMRAMGRDVEVAHAEGEVDRVDVFE